MAGTNVQKTKRHRVTLTDVAFGGDCISRIDNQVIFVSDGVPGDEVIVEITQSRRDFQRGRVVEVIRPSPDRILPLCPIVERCGGCQWQHIEYSAQLRFKRKIVIDQLRRIGGFGRNLDVNETLPAPSPWHYRNNVRFTVQGGRLGFKVEGTHTFLPVDECPIAHPAINKALVMLQGCANQHVDEVTVRYGVNTGQLLIQPKIECDGLATGQEYVEEILGVRKFRISASAFFQVNTLQAEQMVQYVFERLALRANETLADIYCGVGTFGLLAADKVARVTGIEESAVALRDARYNAAGLENVEFIGGAAEKVLVGLKEHVDAAIIDPPRAGCKPEVIGALRRLHPERIVYVSCDPATLARDLRLLCDSDRYRITDIQPIDMFPQTYHVECVVLIERRRLE